MPTRVPPGLELRKRETFLRYQYMLTFGAPAEMSVPAFFSTYQQPVHAEIERVVGGGSSAVERAMAYTALAPSKQVRAVLVLLCAELCRGKAAGAVPAAAAIELVHAASLILDDLPSMDDAPLRRGRRANHLEFGEPVAILAAFGLLNLAYGSIARAYEPAVASRMTSMIAEAVGPAGLIGGQALDLEATDRQIDFETLERIHRGKTGALFVAAAACGALTAGAAAEPIAALSAYAKNLGLAFQIVDDLLDVSGRSVRDRQGDPRRRPEDDVRVVQRRGWRATASRGVMRDGGSRAGAVRRESGPAARAVGVRRREADVPGMDPRDRRAERSGANSTNAPDVKDQRVDELRRQLRSLGYLEAGVDRFVLGPARQQRGPAALAARLALRVGLLGGVLLGRQPPSGSERDCLA